MLKTYDNHFSAGINLRYSINDMYLSLQSLIVCFHSLGLQSSVVLEVLARPVDF